MKKQTDITMFPKPYASPPNKSPAPYLAYELDQLRKQQKKYELEKKYNSDRYKTITFQLLYEQEP